MARSSDIAEIPTLEVRRPSGISEELTSRIVARIENGSAAWIAAVSEGCDIEQFVSWMSPNYRTREPYASFQRAIVTAIARAKSDAEGRTFNKMPDKWLMSGPARSSATNVPTDRVDWTSSTSQSTRNVTKITNAMTINATSGLASIRAIMTALEGFPEAKSAVVESLKSLSDSVEVDPPTLIPSIVR